MMEMSFGEQIERFAMSVDIVDTSLCEKARELFDGYIMNTLRMDFYHVMIDGILVEQTPGLHTATTANQPWCNDGSDSVQIHSINGAFRAQSTYSYETHLPLWITGKNGDTLNEASEYIDSWSGTTNLPNYTAKNKPNIRTSIVIPLKYGERVFGFICMETRQLLEHNEPAQLEFRRIANAIAIILWLHEAHQNQHKCVQEAFSSIRKDVIDKRFPSPLLKPKIFVASSHEADRAVMGSIHNILDKYSAQLEEVFWRDIKDAGDITDQIINEMSQSRFGICYLSEPIENGDLMYTDNANVVYEAGIFHALTGSINATTEAWIPIREPKAPPPPFDLRQQRSVVVSRLSDGALNKDDFEHNLESTIKVLLGL